MEDPTTIALNLTFFGTLGVAFAMFFGLFIVFVLTLVLAGLGRLAAVTAMALAGLLGTSRPAKMEPHLSAEWTAAVARADARAAARAMARAKAQFTPHGQAGDKPQAQERKAG
ncbi:hypothetical protein [Pseudarthrobacter albicanus]|uniref:hypothetical protein n=1 Tax=Pseudarthrobacter albicanus TaxID=2823873 RepID=UPI001BA9E0E5|nr:hypothetical protein [Pseudarthrobacter albicanus]